MSSLARKIFLLALAVCFVAGVSPVFAVHDDNVFELDGNAVDNPAVPGDDWSTALFPPLGNATATTGLIIDPIDNDTTHFKGGSKDTLDISAWGIVTQDDTPKDDIEHAGAAGYVVNSHLIIYAFDDRFATAGTASHGYWFFKNKIGTNGTKFTGVHADGDVLVAIEFQNGGAVAVINVFNWVSNPAPHQPNLQSVFTNTINVTPGVAFCNGDDTICGITNTNTETAPWSYISSTGETSFPPQSFFEIGIDITALTGATCFSSFLASSRSSASATATIKDFALSGFPVCGIEVGKACTGTPTVDGNNLISTFTVPITVKGGGTINAVTLAEVPTVALGTGESCQITDMTPAGVPTLPFTFNGTNPVTLYNTLSGSASITVVCTTTGRNPFINKVAVTAKSSANLSTPDLSDSHETTGEGEVCPTVGNPSLLAQKCCRSVTIDPDTFAPTVCVTINVTNTTTSPAEAIKELTVIDDKLGDVSDQLVGGTLAAGSSQKYKGCYLAASADQTGDPIGADDVTFTDHVTTVSGVGAASGINVSLSGAELPSAQCNLCGDQPACDFDPNDP